MVDYTKKQLKIIRRIRDYKERNRALCALNHRLEDKHNSFIDVFSYSATLTNAPNNRL